MNLPIRRNTLTTELHRGDVLSVLAAVALAGLLPACGGVAAPGAGTEDGVAEEAPAAPAGATDLLGFLQGREVFLPQLAGGPGSPLYVVWQERAEERGSDLFIARRTEAGDFGPPVRVNDDPGGLGGGSLDEGRPAVAVGEGGVLAVAWTGRGGDIRAAVSTDAGETFAPALSLNSDAGTRAYRGFVDVAVDDDGVAHAVWIDGRFAPRGAEEPAELFYARIEQGVVTEINLTEDQQDSICGCCRPDITARSAAGLTVAFRNTGGGYRDVFRLQGAADGTFATPQRLGPPMWELEGCPVIGPLNVGEATLWAEASTGKRRILVATDTGGEYRVAVEDDEDWAIERPPRIVVGSSPGEPMLLVPGRPAGRILRGSGADWRVAMTGIPRWAMSAALIDDRLLLLGSLDGAVQTELVDVHF